MEYFLDTVRTLKRLSFKAFSDGTGAVEPVAYAALLHESMNGLERRVEVRVEQKQRGVLSHSTEASSCCLSILTVSHPSKTSRITNKHRDSQRGETVPPSRVWIRTFHT